jgi:peptide/nickel transport system permease protein
MRGSTRGFALPTASLIRPRRTTKPPAPTTIRTATSLFAPALALARRKPLGALGACLIALLTLAAVFGELLAPFDPLAIDPRALFQPPSLTSGHVLGTDHLGRDQLSRLLVGTRSTLFVAVTGVLVGSVVGALAGLVSGFRGGWVEALLLRLTDVLMAFPILVLALAITAVLGQSERNVILAIAVIQIPQASRVLRSVVLPLRRADFVIAAQAVGASDTRLLFGHVMPQVISPYLIIVSASISGGILIESSLSFLGLGTPPPAPSWGSMLSGATLQNVQRAPWNAIVPGAALTVTVYSFNLLGDAVRDLLDPRMRL